MGVGPLFLCLLLSSGIEKNLALDSLGTYNVDPGSVTVSGISSGAAMATQFHVAYSTNVKGAGIFAGVPYYCAQGFVSGSLTCMTTASLITVPALITQTETFAATNGIDSTSGLSNDRVYIFHGTEDVVVDPIAGQKVKNYYDHYLNSGNIKTVFGMAANHGFPTNFYGGACDSLDSEYIVNCGYNGAYEMLNHLYRGGLIEPDMSSPPVLSGQFLLFDQGEFFYISWPSQSSFDSTGFVYVPSSCVNGAECKLHIAFHGCQQGRHCIGEKFARKTGLLEVAELNDIVVLFPQISPQTLLGNPQGCWDWWSYTTELYPLKTGNQIIAVNRMMRRVIYGE